MKLVHTRDRRNQTEAYLTPFEYEQDPYSHPSIENDEWEQDGDVVQLQHIFEVNDNFRLSTQAYYTDTFRNGLRSTEENEGDLDNNDNITSIFRNCPDEGGEEVPAGNVANPGQCADRHAPHQYYTRCIETRGNWSHNLFSFEYDTLWCALSQRKRAPPGNSVIKCG